MNNREKLKEEWENPETTEDRRIEILELIKEEALSTGYDLKCSHCKELVMFLESDHPVGKGHIYSDAGISEYNITFLCEYCFDEITKDPDDENRSNG